MLIPVVYSLSGTKAGARDNLFYVYFLHPFREYLLKLFTGVYESSEPTDGLAPLFCGTATTVLFVTYFAHDKISKRERIISFLLSAALLLSINISTTYLIWHGLKFTAGFGYRNAFILCFFLVFFAARAWNAGPLHPVRLGICALLCIGTVVFLRPWNYDFMDPGRIAADLAVAACVFAVLFLCRRFPKRSVCLLLAALQFVSLMMNTTIIGRGVSSSEYRTYHEELEDVLSQIRAQDDGLYRMENVAVTDDNYEDYNESLHYAYNSLTHFSSSQKQSTKEFLGLFGLDNHTMNFAKYTEGVPVAADCFFGVRYLIHDEELDKGYEKIAESSGYSVYYNEDALPLMFSADSSVLATDPDTSGAFEAMNAVYTSMSGLDTPIFTAAELQQTGSGDTFTFTAASSGHYYLLAEGPNQSVELYVNGVYRADILGVYNQGSVDLGTFSSGETVELRLCSEDGEVSYTSLAVASEDTDALREHLNQIRGKESAASVTKVDSSHYVWAGTVSAKDQVILFTVPSDEGWHVLVDGEEQTPESAFGHLLAVRVSTGSHTVEFTYTPRGLTLGAAVTGLSVVGTAVFAVLVQRKRRQQ